MPLRHEDKNRSRSQFGRTLEIAESFLVLLQAIVEDSAFHVGLAGSRVGLNRPCDIGHREIHSIP